MSEVQENNFIGDFDDKFQRAIVGHMMRDRAFRMMVFSNEISYEHFRDPYVATIADKMKKESTTEAGQGILGPGEMYQLICHDYKDDKDRNKVKAACEDCYSASQEYKIEIVSQKMTGWIRLLRLKQMILKATELVNKKDYNNALNFVEGVARQLGQIDFTPENKTTVRFDNTVNFLLQQDTNRFLNNCTIGSPEFDELLLEGAAVKAVDRVARDKQLDEELEKHIKDQLYKTGRRPNVAVWPMSRETRGSLMPGDATILLGPANAGKTTIICTLVASNILMGKDVLLIVHEQHSDDIKLKILQAMLFMDSQGLTALAKAKPEVIQFYEHAINRHLTYVHYIKAGQMNVEAVGGIIEMKQDKWKALYGKGYDLMVNDYPGKLTARSLGHRNNTKRHEEIAFVYDYLINLGREHKFHSFLAMQTNREGYKVAQGTNGEGRVVDMGDASESFNPMQLADNVITINRGDEDKMNKRIRLYVGKSRKSQTGNVFVSKTDMARSRAYGLGFYTDYETRNGVLVPFKRSLPSFTIESKVKGKDFDEMCFKVFGEQQRKLKDEAERQVANALSNATEPAKKDSDMLTAFAEPVPVKT